MKRQSPAGMQEGREGGSRSWVRETLGSYYREHATAPQQPNLPFQSCLPPPLTTTRLEHPLPVPLVSFLGWRGVCVQGCSGSLGSHTKCSPCEPLSRSQGVSGRAGGGSGQCPEKQRQDRRMGRRMGLEQIPSSEEMRSHSHFPTCRAREAREEGGEIRDTQPSRMRMTKWGPPGMSRDQMTFI